MAAGKGKGAAKASKAPKAKPTKKAPAGSKATRKRKPRSKRARTKAAADGIVGEVDVRAIPKGRNLNNAQKAVRDDMIVTRVAMGWTFPEIGAEVGLSADQVRRNYKARLSVMPDVLGMDPLDIVRMLVQGYLTSIMELSKIAANTDQAASQVGAIKAQNDARRQLQQLLQATGKLPHELGTLRVLSETRVVVTAIVGGLDEFVEKVRERVKAGDVPEEAADVIEGFATELKGDLRQVALMGGGDANG